jgi:hypothetical protein
VSAVEESRHGPFLLRVWEIPGGLWNWAVFRDGGPRYACPDVLRSGACTSRDAAVARGTDLFLGWAAYLAWSGDEDREDGWHRLGPEERLRWLAVGLRLRSLLGPG